MQTDEKLDFQKRIPELDGIRGFAMIMVLISHFAEWGTYAGSNIFIKTLLAISFAGFTGLDLFFVLSGFLICGILIDNREALNYYKVFYVRR
ncbi:MAG: acyltransferase, partial [Acidobacteria bacterium]|nr:acyltransferase [Acidobacteriota bacterium]